MSYFDSSRYCVGVIPVFFLNTDVKYADVLKPSSMAMLVMLRFGSRSIPLEISMRRYIR